MTEGGNAMHILSFLANYYGEGILSRFVLVLVSWLVWPGLMFAVGLVFESRVVPIGKGQSKMFFPGDLAIGIILVGIISMYDKTGTYIPMVDSPYWWIVVVVVMAVVAIRARKGDAISYPPRAARSPTKITHDVMGYFLSPVLMIGLGIPQLGMLEEEGVFAATRLGWLAVAMGVVLYLFCTALDLITFYDSNDIASRHPEDWVPIWRKR